MTSALNREVYILNKGVHDLRRLLQDFIAGAINLEQLHAVREEQVCALAFLWFDRIEAVDKAIACAALQLAVFNNVRILLACN